MRSCCRHRRPLSIRNVHEFAEENLVFAADNDVLLGLLELLSLFLFRLVLLHVGVDLTSRLRLDHSLSLGPLGKADLRDLVQLGLVNALVAATETAQSAL